MILIVSYEGNGHVESVRKHLNAESVVVDQAWFPTSLRLDLMRAFDLKYGAVDFRVTPDGEHVFLEVNPAGEFLFVSERTGQPIAAAIAGCLDRHEAEHQRNTVSL